MILKEWYKFNSPVLNIGMIIISIYKNISNYSDELPTRNMLRIVMFIEDAISMFGNLKILNIKNGNIDNINDGKLNTFYTIEISLLMKDSV